MAITKYVLSEARKLNPIGSVESYNEQRQKIYEKFLFFCSSVLPLVKGS